MKYIDEFRNGKSAEILKQAIFKEAHLPRYKFMEFCGGHTHAIYRYGIPTLLPKNVELVHGPGCPVCILPMGRIDQAIALSQMPNVIFCSYGDMLRVPGTNRKSLLKAKAEGADVRMIYSVDDALRIAEENPHREIIFFAIGFETTTPPTAVAIKKAEALKLDNFKVFCNHVLTPVAMSALLEGEQDLRKTSIFVQNKAQLEASSGVYKLINEQRSKGCNAVMDKKTKFILSSVDNENRVNIDGFIGPAHVSIIIGSEAYQKVGSQYHKPIVISGFEPLDILHSILMLIRQLNEGRCEVENQYTRAVKQQGNLISQQIMDDVLEIRETFEWRGLGWIPQSALQIKTRYADFDAEKCYSLPSTVGKETKGCICGSVLRGIKKPSECKLFATVCGPENPLGSCMVSSEGACAAVYAYSVETRCIASELSVE